MVNRPRRGGCGPSRLREGRASWRRQSQPGMLRSRRRSPSPRSRSPLSPWRLGRPPAERVRATPRAVGGTSDDSRALRQSLRALISSPWPDRLAYLGYEDETTWRHEIILHRVTTAKRSDPDAVDVARRIDPEANRAHIDIGVDDVDMAIAQVERIGGRLKYPPTVYPIPHAYEGARPLIDWAVMQDPFGNEFCLVRELTAPNAGRSTQPLSMAPPPTTTGVPSPAAPDPSIERCRWSNRRAQAGDGGGGFDPFTRQVLGRMPVGTHHQRARQGSRLRLPSWVLRAERPA